MIGFMGCYAAMNALKLAHHIVRSEASARVLTVNLELCTLHLKDTTDSSRYYHSFCSRRLRGIYRERGPGWHRPRQLPAVLVPGTRELITWNIREAGFDMVLSGGVPAAIHDGLQEHGNEILAGAPSARSIFGRCIPAAAPCSTRSSALSTSRGGIGIVTRYLARYGNMSSATVMFVIEKLLRSGMRVAPAARCRSDPD